MDRAVNLDSFRSDWINFRRSKGWSIRESERRAGLGSCVIRKFEAGRDSWVSSIAAIQTLIQSTPRQISPEQRRVWVGIANGLELKQIATERGVSVKTVEFHRTQLCRRLGVPGANNVILARMAIREGLVRL